jgi:hypothetical protein
MTAFRLIVPAALVLAIAAFLLAACAGSPPRFMATPDAGFDALQARATLEQYGTRQAEAAVHASATYAAFIAAQEGTRSALAAQQTAVAQATYQSIAATQTQVAAGEQTRQAVAVAAVTGTAIAMSTQEIRDAVLTVEAGAVQRQAAAIGLQATATRLSLEAERDREAAARGRWWAGMWLAAVAALVGGLLFLLYSFAARWWNESRIIRDGHTGKVIAVRLGRGVLEYVSEPPAPLLLPAPAEEAEDDYVREGDLVRTNYERPRAWVYKNDVELHWNDMVAVLSQEQISILRRWYEGGDPKIRRERSRFGFGTEDLPQPPAVSSGSAYNTLRAVLIGNEYITESGDWTPRGVIELLRTAPRGPSSPSSSSPSPSNGRQTVIGD